MSAGWSDVDFSEPELLLLASNVTAARAYLGKYKGPIGEGGDASKVDLSDLSLMTMQKNVTYAGTVGTLHESVPVLADVHRTVVRLNCPGVSLH
jgi:hypothetical protein